MRPRAHVPPVRPFLGRAGRAPAALPLSTLCAYLRLCRFSRDSGGARDTQGGSGAPPHPFVCPPLTGCRRRRPRNGPSHRHSPAHALAIRLPSRQPLAQRRLSAGFTPPFPLRICCTQTRCSISANRHVAYPVEVMCLCAPYSSPAPPDAQLGGRGSALSLPAFPPSGVPSISPSRSMTTNGCCATSCGGNTGCTGSGSTGCTGCTGCTGSTGCTAS